MNVETLKVKPSEKKAENTIYVFFFFKILVQPTKCLENRIVNGSVKIQGMERWNE